MWVNNMSNQFKEGEIPPLGEKCEVKFDNNSWQACVYKGVFGEKIWFSLSNIPNQEVINFSYRVNFRPIQTEKQRVIEKVMIELEIITPSVHFLDNMEKLHDLRMLVMPGANVNAEDGK